MNTATYTPRGASLELMGCTAPEVLIDGPARTGKTRGVWEYLYLYCANNPGARVLVTRKTRASMTTTVLQTFEDDVLGYGHPLRSGPSRQTRRTYWFPNGASIDVLGLDNPERIMSSEYDVVVVFEATECQLHDFEMLTSRLSGKFGAYRQIICDCNPHSDRHWLIQRARTGRMCRLQSRHEDNPRWWTGTGWTKEGRELRERLGALTGARRARLFEGRWASAENAVYEDFEAAVHVVPAFTIPADWRRYRSIDFGFSNPFCCQWWAVDGDGRLYLYREIYTTKTTFADLAARITALSEGERIEATIADPEDAEGRATLAKLGIPTVAAKKDVQTGIQAVQLRMRTSADGKPRLVIFDTTLAHAPDETLLEKHLPIKTVDEVDGYVWAQERDGKPTKEAPAPSADHGLDAMRYMVMHLDNRSDVAWAKEPDRAKTASRFAYGAV